MLTSRARRLIVVCACCTGCVTGGLGSVPTPAEIPGLEAEHARDRGDMELGLRLATAYREAGRADDARALVDELLERAPADPGLLTLRGLLAEDLGDWAFARASYAAILDASPSRALRQRIEQRLAVVRRQELAADVRAALAREAEVAQSSPDPTTVGVFPFVYEGDDPAWEPLALALPELLTTDLAVTGRLTVLERLRVQALVTELALAEAGRLDPTTAARSGRLLGSGHVVQGRFRVDAETRLSVDAVVVDVLAPGAEQTAPVVGEDAIERFFELEKQLAFDIYAEMGVQLTVAERERINERQTESVEALLAFGRGLMAADAGDFALAAQSFAEAESLDPSFALATDQREEAELTEAATTAGAAADLSSTAQQVSLQQQAVQDLSQSPVSAQQLILGGVAERQRSVIAEVLGQDRVGQATLLELILRVPGGGP